MHRVHETIQHVGISMGARLLALVAAIRVANAKNLPARMQRGRRNIVLVHARLKQSRTYEQSRADVSMRHVDTRQRQRSAARELAKHLTLKKSTGQVISEAKLEARMEARAAMLNRRRLRLNPHGNSARMMVI